jgi:hypothetical protein
MIACLLSSWHGSCNVSSARYAPTAAQYQALTAYATASGLTIQGTHAGHTVLDIAGPSGTVGKLFGVSFERAQTADGRAFSEPSAAVHVPSVLTALGAQAVGLNSRPAIHDNVISHGLIHNNISTYGSGPGGTFAPNDIRTAYQVSSLPQTGTGQRIALFELSTADYPDATVFSSTYGLPAPNVNPINVDGGTTDFSGGTEVILDIDMAEIMGRSPRSFYRPPRPPSV